MMELFWGNGNALCLDRGRDRSYTDSFVKTQRMVRSRSANLARLCKSSLKR